MYLPLKVKTAEDLEDEKSSDAPWLFVKLSYVNGNEKLLIASASVLITRLLYEGCNLHFVLSFAQSARERSHENLVIFPPQNFGSHLTRADKGWAMKRALRSSSDG